MIAEEPASSPDPQHRRAWLYRHWHQLGAVALGVALRFPTVVNGLPYIQHPDEPVNYGVIHHMVTAPTLKPGFYDYPSLQYQMQAVVHSAVGNLGVWAGWWHSFSDLRMEAGRGIGTTLVAHSAPWAVARIVTLVIACVGLWVAAGLAARLCRSQGWGAFAGSLAAVSGIGVATGAVITPDALAGTTAIITLALLVDLVDRAHDGPPTRRWVVGTAVALGLAVGSKYNNGALLAAVAIAVACTPSPARPTRRQWLTFAGIAAGTFVLSTPAVLIDLPNFVKGVRHLLEHYAHGHDFADGPWYTDVRFLAASDGLALVLTAAALVFRRTRTTWLLAGWLGTYLVLLSITTVHFARNLTPVLGTVAVLAAVGAQQLWQRARAFAREPHTLRPHAAAGVAVTALLVISLPVAAVQARTTVHDWRRQLVDHQALARHWLERQIPRGWKVLADDYSPWLDRGAWTVISKKLSLVDDEGYLAHTDAIVATSGGSGKYLDDPTAYPEQTTRVERIRMRACAIRHFDDGWGTWVEVWYLRCGGDSGIDADRSPVVRPLPPLSTRGTVSP